jgi:hypothetical protein
LGVIKEPEASNGTQTFQQRVQADLFAQASEIESLQSSEFGTHLGMLRLHGSTRRARRRIKRICG